MANRLYDLTGQKFGRWTVIRRASNDVQRAATWFCRCDCGTERIVRGYALRYGHTNSCGCLQAEQVAKRDWKHGGSRTKLYRIWDSMKKRCISPTEPAYKNYGGRGISVCDEWLRNFEAFQNWAISSGYHPGLSIDRIDNDGNYCPENCRWSDTKTQCNNRRSNNFIEFNGELHTLSEWESITGISQSTIAHRIKAGWTVEKALTEPARLRRWWKKPKNE